MRKTTHWVHTNTQRLISLANKRTKTPNLGSKRAYLWRNFTLWGTFIYFAKFWNTFFIRILFSKVIDNFWSVCCLKKLFLCVFQICQKKVRRAGIEPPPKKLSDFDKMQTRWKAFYCIFWRILPMSIDTTKFLEKLDALKVSILTIFTKTMGEKFIFFHFSMSKLYKSFLLFPKTSIHTLFCYVASISVPFSHSNVHFCAS